MKTWIIIMPEVIESNIETKTVINERFRKCFGFWVDFYYSLTISYLSTTILNIWYFWNYKILEKETKGNVVYFLTTLINTLNEKFGKQSLNFLLKTSPTTFEWHDVCVLITIALWNKNSFNLPTAMKNYITFSHLNYKLLYLNT